MIFKNNNQLGFAHPIGILAVVFVLALIGFAGWRVSERSSSKNSSESEGTSSKLTSKESAPTAEASLKEKAETNPTEVTVPAPAANKTTKSTAPTTSKTPTTAAATNCGGSLYSGTNTAFMASDAYVATNKFKAALEFAGLTSTVNTNKTVVFTMSDSIFDSLSTEQLAFMNASPANMKSVLGWHIVQSCQTYAAVFKDATGPVTFQTLNGPVTYTQSGLGKIESAQIAIWDWFTTNGAVHYISDYIKPPQI